MCSGSIEKPMTTKEVITKCKRRIKFYSQRLFQLYDCYWDWRIAGRVLERTEPAYNDETLRSMPTKYHALYEIFRDSELTAEDSFIDVGCGKGRVFAYLLKCHFPGSITGVELNPEVAAVAQAWIKRYPQVKIVVGNAFDMNYDDYTVMYLFRPFKRRFVIQLIQLLESQLTHPLRLYFLTDQFSGDYIDQRPQWRLIKRGQVYRKHGLFLFVCPQRYSVWEYVPQR